MRIATSTIFENGGNRISDLQVGLARTQQQLSTGRRVLVPADDPVASSQILEVTQANTLNTQYGTNRQGATASLSAVEGTLQGVTTLLQDVKEAIVNAGNGALTSTERQFIATDLRSKYNELLGLANATDGNGNYLFSGYQTGTIPFTAVAGGATYQGDQGQRLLQVDSSRVMATSDTGNAIFQNIQTGSSGPFLTTSNSANTGGGSITSSSVVNQAALTGHNYDITFTSATTFDVRDLTTGNLVTVTPSNTYASGTAIQFDGLQLTIADGATAPASGDKFKVQPSRQDVFKTLDDLILTLQNVQPTNNISSADLSASLATANDNIDKALNNVLTVRASVGSRLAELDSLDNVGGDRTLQYSQTLSQLQDLDYAKAITELSQRQTTLEAAQQSFVKTSGLSLFNFIS